MSGQARVGLALALLALGAGLGQATAGPDVPGAAGPARVPVVGATAVCPAGPVAAGSAGTGPGALLAGPLDRPAVALPVTGAGQVLPGVRGPVVRARGAVAAGLAVEHVLRVEDGPVRGLTAVRCAAPTASAWFVGGGTGPGETGELVLVNADGTPAVVDVQGWSVTGPLGGRAGRGIAVPARTRVRVPLDRLAPDRDLLALQVVTSRGRVAPYLRHTRSDGRVPRGTDWVPQSGPPSPVVVLPALPGGPGRRTVVVANPGAEDTTVRLQLTTADGQLQPEELAVPAGTTVARDVSAALARTPAAARLVSSDGPVLAGALVEDDLGGAVRELAWAGAAAALTGPALLADVRLSPSAEHELLLSALDADALVDVVPVPVRRPGGASPGAALPGPRRVAVAGGTTARLALSGLVPRGAPARLAFEVRPVRGSVHAGRVLRGRDGTGPLVAALPLTSLLPAVVRPRVAADPLAGA